MQQSDGDHQKLLTQVIQKQIVILGPDITLTKARNVKGLTIADDGSVTEMSGDPQELTKQLIEQFMELSGLIVKKTMEPLLASYPTLMAEQITKTQAPILSPSNPQSTPPFQEAQAQTPAQNPNTVIPGPNSTT